MSIPTRQHALLRWPVYALSASVGVSVAAVSISKLLAVLAAIGVGVRQRAELLDGLPRRTALVTLLMLAALALSIPLADAPLAAAWGDWVKYTKLLLIVLVPWLVRTRQHIQVALLFHGAMQTFILLSSCALALGLELPWVKDPILIRSHSVFHEYLQQSIMTAAFAGLCWHLRHEWGQRWTRHALMLLAALSLFNVLFLLKGRTGYAVAAVVVVAAVAWELRARWRLGALVLGLVLLVGAFEAAPQLRSRLELAATEVTSFQLGNLQPSSVGSRLNFWARSVQAISEKPLTGYGAGSWPGQYQRLDKGLDPWYPGRGGNPHQEYLLWGVLLGVGGIALQLALLWALWRDSVAFAHPQRRALRTMVLVLAVTNLFNCALYDSEIGDYFCLMLGLLMAWGKLQSAKPATTEPTVPHTAKPTA